MANFGTCGNVWLTRVRWPPCEHAGNDRTVALGHAICGQKFTKYLETVEDAS